MGPGLALARRLAVALAIAGAAGAPRAFAHDEERFVASWAVGHIQPLAANVVQYTNQTVREVVRTSVGGRTVRVRIANTFGADTLVIGEAHIAVSAGGAKIVPATDRVLTFGGQTSVKVYAGAPALSDPVDLDVHPLTDMAVTLYLPDATPLEGGGWAAARSAAGHD